MTEPTHVLVPLEPTPEMFGAGHTVVDTAAINKYRPSATVGDIWRAMVAAAPPPPAPPPPPPEALGKPAPKRPELVAMFAEAKDNPPSDAELAVQRESFVRGEMGMGSDADEAEYRRRERKAAEKARYEALVECLEVEVNAQERGFDLAREAAAQARREALRDAAKKATSFLVGDTRSGIPLRSPTCHEVAAAIRAMIDAPAEAPAAGAQVRTFEQTKSAFLVLENEFFAKAAPATLVPRASLDKAETALGTMAVSQHKLERENLKLRADLGKALEALREIATHWAIQYDHPRMAGNAMYDGPYGTGVTDGHRAAASIARAVLAELCPDRPQDSPEEGRDRG